MQNSTATQEAYKHSLTEAGFNQFLRIWQASIPNSRFRRVIVFSTGLALICGAAALIGAVPTRIYGHDIFIYLGNGWRVLNGQRPHVDFSSPWGPVGFLVSALGLALAHHSVVGIGYGCAIFSLIVGIWAFLLGDDLTYACRLLASFFLAAVVAAPYPLGLPPINSSYAMIYNRYSYGLLGLVLLECFRAAHLSRKRDQWVGGLSTGAVLSLMLFMKASYFFVGIAMICIMALFFGQIFARRIAGILTAFALLSICVLAYLRFDVAAVIRDLRMAAGARSETMKFPLYLLLSHWPALLGVVVFCLATNLLMRHSAQWGGIKFIVLGAIMFFADMGLIRSNAQSDGFLVCATFAIIILSEVTKRQQELSALESQQQNPAYAAVLCLGALLILPQFGSDLIGLGFGLWQKEKPSHAASLLRFTSPNLRPLLLYESDDNPPSEGRAFTTYVNEGVALLQREAGPNEAVLTMDVTNPFPYAMERRPPRGGHAAPTYNYNMTDRFRPSDDEYFGDADIVMLPKRPSQGDNHYLDFFKAYSPGLYQRYYLAAETNRWWMYRRRPQPTKASNSDVNGGGAPGVLPQ